MEGFTRDFDVASGALTTTSPKNNLVEFFLHPLELEAKSQEAGRPIFQDRLMVRIITPGDNRAIVERIATIEDKAVYARQYTAYEKMETMSAEGTPLEQWPVLSKSAVRMYKYHNIFTLEQLANLSDDQLSMVGALGGRTTRRQAQVFLETASKGALPAAIVADNERLKSMLSNLEQQMAAMNTRYESLLRDKGGDPTKEAAMVSPRSMSMAEKLSTMPDTVIAEATKVVPDNWETLPAKDMIALAEKVTGLKFARAHEAKAAIEESVA